MNKTEPVSGQVFGELVAYLGTRGLAGNAIRAAIGNTAGGRTRDQISAALIAWLSQQ